MKQEKRVLAEKWQTKKDELDDIEHQLIQELEKTQEYKKWRESHPLWGINRVMSVYRNEIEVMMAEKYGDDEQAESFFISNK
ncbi:hypothetical protein P7H46_12190 [Enterococcus pseudoavium]|uniref:Uncharacterized protein n=1 Tax=Enterococcus pseudoavium TaxID=44007 RepID=A0ABU3FNI6_9ENTE|nr:hypothetical protein [Enterococcus pseudoavium]MDT2771579.1 hypothetical protein [Enterococcus pseudoavium]